MEIEKNEERRRSYPRGDFKELEKLYYRAANAVARARQMGESKTVIDQLNARVSALKEMMDEAKRELVQTTS